MTKIRKSSSRKLAYMKRYRLANLEHERARSKKWYSVPENREKALAKGRIYTDESRFRNRIATFRYRAKNREKCRRAACVRGRLNRKRQWHRHVERYESDPVYNLAIKIRRRIHVALKKGHKGTRKVETSVKLLGCSYQEFKRYIESKFTEVMTWDGVFDGKIHIDHINPISSFNLLEPLQQKAAFHFTNTQPLWAQENLIKSASDKIKCRTIIPFEEGELKYGS